jgi:hypothetical protein
VALVSANTDTDGPHPCTRSVMFATVGLLLLRALTCFFDKRPPGRDTREQSDGTAR